MHVRSLLPSPSCHHTSLFLFLVIGILAGCQPEKSRDDRNTYGEPFKKNIRATGPRTAEEELKGFILPPGFEIQLFASEPDIEKPMNITFDAKGRLWVTSSFEYPFPMIGKTGTDKLTILEDTDGDGKADKFTRVSDTLNIPIGILPLADGALSFSVPNLYRYFDNNHDDQMEQSKFLLGPFGYQDTHGMVSNFIRGYDGWVHACHGFTNYSKFAGTDGDSIILVSGNTFRFNTNGSRVEQLTFGQVNPFGLVFDAYGYVYSTDSHSSPLYQLIRSGDYPHFGKMSNMGFGPDMKSLKDEATSLCGITQYADVLFPEEFQNSFFIGDVVNSRVHRYSFTWKGSSPVGKSEVDFIKSEDPWFRPVNIKLGPDGALYVADFYNAIIGHYEVSLNHPKRDRQRGRIWRITYKGKKNERRDLTKSTLDELIKALDADNLPLRMAATDQITDRLGNESTEALVKVLSNPSGSRQYVHALWALHRLDKLSGNDLQKAVTSPDTLIRLHAFRVLLERPASDGFYDVIASGLSDPNPHVRRSATEAVVKYPTVKSIESTLALLEKTPQDFDTHLYYTARLALRNMLRHEPTLAEVSAKQWTGEQAALLAGVMVDVPLPASATFLADYMSKGTLDRYRVPPAYTQIARFVPVAQLPAIVKQALSQGDVDLKAFIYKGLRDGLAQRLGHTGTEVLAPYAPSLASDILAKYPATDTADFEEKYVHQRTAIDMVGDFKITSLQPELKKFIDEGPAIGWGMRQSALRSLLKIDLANMAIGLNILQHDSVREYQRRQLSVMAEFPGKALNDALNMYGPVPADVQEAVVVALAGSPQGKDIAFRKASQGTLNPRALTGNRAREALLSKASPQQRKQYDDLTGELTPISEELQKIIDQRIAYFNALDRSHLSIDSGRAVFEQNCGVCHKLGGQLGVGPQLDGIGSTGTSGLIEKIVDPNRNISKAFRNYSITLKDGTLKTGLFRRQQGDARVYADITGKEFTIQKGDISEEKLSKFTLMPDSFSGTIEERDFYQLVNYLLTL
ncbi:PVC-type heme-binding CxxCH protein [Chryseolinea sp. T2]|uniref:PVC-type heme-binding CxxCH protein n=1 Tax=Chryseolinea sp. T2 TaxID=3129255 RepID=UPI0030783EEF